MSNSIHLLGGLGITRTELIIYDVVAFIAIAIPMFQLNRKANYPYPWMAFIPGFSNWALFRVIRISPWNMLWLVLLLAGYAVKPFGVNGIAIAITVLAFLGFVVVAIIWWVKLFNAFGMNANWLFILLGVFIPLVQLLIPVAFTVLIWTLAFNNEYRYKWDSVS